MVCLRVLDPEKLLAGVEPAITPDQSHVTLAYLGNDPAFDPAELQASLKGLPQVDNIRVIGGGSLGGDGAVVAFCEWVGMNALFYRVRRTVDALALDGHFKPNFVAHSTLAYPEPMDLPGALLAATRTFDRTFSAVPEIWFGDRRLPLV